MNKNDELAGTNPQDYHFTIGKADLTTYETKNMNFPDWPNDVGNPWIPQPWDRPLGPKRKDADEKKIDDFFEQMGSRRVNKNNTRPLINVKENKDKKTAKVNIAGFEDHEIDIYYASGKLRVISNHTRDIDTDIITPIDHSVDIGNNYILNEIFTQNKILFIRFSKLEKGSTDKYPIGYNRFAEQSKYVK